jgi:hypothetical protein
MSGRNRNYGNNNSRNNNGNYSRGNGNSMPQNFQNIGIQDLLGGKQLEFVAAALLLTGKLQVDSVELFRGSPVINVNLIGKYTNQNNNKSNPLSDFLDQNGDMTIDDIFDAFKNKVDKG